MANDALNTSQNISNKNDIDIYFYLLIEES